MGPGVKEHSSFHLRLLDLETLEDLTLLEVARPGLVLDLAARFETARGLQLEELQTCVLAGDTEQAALLLHSMRGGAAALGMQALAEAFDLLESELPRGNGQLTDLQPLMQASIAALRLRFNAPAIKRS